MSSGVATAVDMRPGQWVRFDGWEQWRFVVAARHVPFRPTEPRATGFVQYDAADTPQGTPVFFGFATHRIPCHLVTVTPEAVTS